MLQTLKTWFTRIIDWIAYPIAKLEERIVAMVAPAIAALKMRLAVKWTVNTVLQVIGGVLLAGLMAAIVAFAAILSITGLTLALMWIMPAILANFIAIVVSVGLGYAVLRSAERQAGDVISSSMSRSTSKSLSS